MAAFPGGAPERPEAALLHMHRDERFKAVGAERVVAAPFVPRRSKERGARLIVVAYFARVVFFIEPLIADTTVVLEQG